VVLCLCLPDLQFVPIILHLLNVDIDREMGVDVAHLIFVSSCYAGDEVLDDGLDGAEGSDILARAVVDLDLYNIFAFGVLGEGECDGDVGEVFCEFSCGNGVLDSGRRQGEGGEGDGLPRGPSTVTMRLRMWILTPSGMTSCSWEKIYFILSSIG
jgi:hypothetical protein